MWLLVATATPADSPPLAVTLQALTAHMLGSVDTVHARGLRALEGGSRIVKAYVLQYHGLVMGFVIMDGRPLSI